MKHFFILTLVFGLSNAFGQAPDNWKVNPAGYEHFMTFTGLMQINLTEVTEKENVIAAFRGSEIRGLSTKQVINNKTYHFLQVYGNINDGDISFKAYDVLADTVLTVNGKENFVPNRSFGDPQNPYLFIALNTKMPPVAIAGKDQNIREGRQGLLDGSQSWSSVEDELSFKWQADDLIKLDSANLANTSFTAPIVDKDTVFSIILQATNSKLISSFDTLALRVLNNLKPVAVAKADLNKSTKAVSSFGFTDSRAQYVFPSALVQLDGSFSYDPEKDDLAFLWTGSQNISFSSNNVYNPTFTAPNNSKDEIINLVLTVSDYEFSSLPDTVSIIVSNNTAPEISINYPKEVIEGDIVLLDGSATKDAQNDPLKYLWKFPESLSLSDTSKNKTTFTVPSIEKDTSYEILFLAWDGHLGFIDTIRIVAKNNTAPIADAGNNFTTREGKRVELDGYFSLDPDSRPLKYYWRSLSQYVLDDSMGQLVNFNAPKLTVPKAQISYELTVDDGVETDKDTLSMTVIGNFKPLANAGQDIYIKKNTLTSLDASKSFDLEMDSLFYYWSAPESIALSDSTAISPIFKSPNFQSDTSFVVTLKVADYLEESSLDSIEIFILADLPPIAIGGKDQIVKPGTNVLIDGSASYDPDNNASYLGFEWNTNSEIYLSDIYNDSLSFVAPNYGIDSTVTFSLVVMGIEKRSEPELVNISIVDNFPPNARAGNDTLLLEGKILTLDASQSFDLDNNDLSYQWRVISGTSTTLSKKKGGDQNFQIISGISSSQVRIQTPNVVGAGEVFIVELAVSDGLKTSKDTINIAVTNNLVPVANAGKNIEEKEGKVVYLDGNKSKDLDGSSLLYDWEFPQGIIAKNESTPAPYFTAPIVEKDSSFLIFLKVGDGIFWSKKDTMEMTIINNASPVANAGKDKIVLSGSIVSLNGDQSFDGDGDNLSYFWVGPESIKLADPYSSNPSFVAPIVMDSRALIFTLTVSDGGVDVPADSAIITVDPISNHVTIIGPDSTIVLPGEVIPIQLLTSPNFTIKGASLHYARGGQDSLTKLIMNKESRQVNGDSYLSLIPANDVTQNGIIYEIRIIDNMNSTHSLGPKQISIYFDNSNLSTANISSGYPEGIAQNSWKTISFPGNLKYSSRDSVLILSGFDSQNYNSLWKLWNWTGQEWIDAVTVETGKGYWFSHRNNLPSHLTLGSGQSANLDKFEYQLKPGWNMVASPYAFPLKMTFDQDTLIGPYEYINDAIGWAEDFPTKWLPFKSYAIFNTTDDIVLHVIYAYNRKIEYLNVPSRVSALPLSSWSVDLILHSKGAIEKNNILGLSKAASNFKDKFDHPEPLSIIPRTTLSFVDSENNFSTRNFKQANEGHVWNAILTFKPNVTTAIIAPQISGDLPSEWDAVIINKNTNKIFSLNSSFEVSILKDEVVEFSIVAGDRHYIDKIVSEYGITIPTSFALNQNYPNPFNPSTSIRYDIAVQGISRINIYDVLGRNIKTLINSYQSPGKYVIQWNGKDKNGFKVSAGVYFYQLNTASFTKTNKMILLK